MPITVNVRAAKARLSQLLDQAESGETVTITRRGRPVARLVPVDPIRGRVPGRLRGRIEMAPDFDDTPEEIIDAFEGRPER